MARVKLWGSLSCMADGQKEFEIDAPNIDRMLTALGEAAPKLDKFQAIQPDSEVYILPKMAGG